MAGYTVKPNDTLWGIYGPNWRQASGYTGDPTKLAVGAQLPSPQRSNPAPTSQPSANFSPMTPPSQSSPMSQNNTPASFERTPPATQASFNPVPLAGHPTDTSQSAQQSPGWVKDKTESMGRVAPPSPAPTPNSVTNALTKVDPVQTAKQNLDLVKQQESERQAQSKAINTLSQKVLKAVPENGRGAATHNLPLIVQALQAEGILDPRTLAYALATIQRETGGTFAPVREGFSDAVGKQQAINNGYGGGENYYGRGFIQLTHADNYKKIGERIGMGDQLVNNPDLALDPEISAKILAAFFKDRGVAEAAQKGDFVGARRPVNGTDHAFDIANNANQYLASIPINLGQ